MNIPFREFFTLDMRLPPAFGSNILLFVSRGVVVCLLDADLLCRLASGSLPVHLAARGEVFLTVANMSAPRSHSCLALGSVSVE